MQVRREWMGSAWIVPDYEVVWRSVRERLARPVYGLCWLNAIYRDTGLFAIASRNAGSPPNASGIARAHRLTDNENVSARTW